MKMVEGFSVPVRVALGVPTFGLRACVVVLWIAFVELVLKTPYSIAPADLILPEMIAWSVLVFVPLTCIRSERAFWLWWIPLLVLSVFHCIALGWLLVFFVGRGYQGGLIVIPSAFGVAVVVNVVCCYFRRYVVRGREG